MGGACSTHGREKRIQNLSWEDMKGRDHSEDPGVNESLILESILGK